MSDDYFLNKLKLVFGKILFQKMLQVNKMVKKYILFKN
jgi:hypothetical protein